MIRVLYVDDNPFDRALVKDALEKEHGGFELVEAASRERFETLLAEGGYDVVLSDFNILGFQGLQVIELVQARYPGLPVVIVTGTGSEEIALQALKRGAADYVIKTPRHIRHLPYALEAVVEKGRVEAERAAMDAALRDSEERFRQLAENIREVFWLSTPDKQRMIYVSPAYEEIWGRSCESLYRSPLDWMEAIHPEDREEVVRAALEEQTKGAYDLAYRIVRPDGQVRWIRDRAFPVRDADGQIYRIAGIAEDITHEKNAEEALRTSEARLKAVLNSVLDGIITVDAEGKVLDCNPAGEALFGLARRELVGKFLEQLIAPLADPRGARRAWSNAEDLDLFLDARVADKLAAGVALKDYFVGGANPLLGKRTEMKAFTAKGKTLPVEVAVTRIGSSGKPVFAVTVRDLSEEIEREEMRRRAEELAKQNELIRQANRLKSEFLANMSHELRTPLNAIIGFAEIMHDGRVGPISEFHREYLSDILSSARHLLQLINDILDLSKVEAGKMEFYPEPLDLERLVSEARSVVHGLAARKKIELQVEVDPFLKVVSDARSLKQVLYNYLSNAIKFTDEGGRVALRLQAEPPEHFRIEVEDTGIGIAAEDIGRLFSEFQQLDSGAGKHYQGTGLGLALTRRIVEAQGGKVGVKSEPGKGSLFYAVLPREAAESAPRVR
ncbi:MAG TPA: PAS domain S-box protein [Candidatus Binatia bacterium]|nr:PAS domain S-box protein [Candidatus Binatia bacterium]